MFGTFRDKDDHPCDEDNILVSPCLKPNRID